MAVTNFTKRNLLRVHCFRLDVYTIYRVGRNSKHTHAPVSRPYKRINGNFIITVFRRRVYNSLRPAPRASSSPKNKKFSD